MLPFRHLLPMLLASAAGLLAENAPISTESPFLPNPEAARGAAPAAGQAKYQLAGITVVGTETLVTIADAEQKRQRTVAVGAKSGDFEVLRCDPEQGMAVIKVGGETQTLTLRKPTSKAGPNAAPQPAPVGPPAIPNIGPAGGALPPVKPLVTREEQEREARMLVSDLLEIGMQQRKAYEEAMRKQAEANRKK